MGALRFKATSHYNGWFTLKLTGIPQNVNITTTLIQCQSTTNERKKQKQRLAAK